METGGVFAGWAIASCLMLSFVSAVVPWVNAEVILLGFAATVGSTSELAVVVVVVTAGQMIGKCLLYEASRRAAALPRHADEAASRWQRRLSSVRSAPLTLVFVSSVVGVPPFYLVTLVAGALRIGVGRFVAAGTLGRLVRFGCLVAVPHLLAASAG